MPNLKKHTANVPLRGPQTRLREPASKTPYWGFGIIPVLCLAACSVGPDFHASKAPVGAGYGLPAAKPTPTVASAGLTGGAQDFIAADLPADWWTLFGSRNFAALITTAIADNPSLQASEARLNSAHETELAAHGALFPSLALNFSPLREKESAAQIGITPAEVSTQGIPTTLTVFSAMAQISYTFDVWGSARRGIEQAQANAEQQKFQMIGARNMLAANTANYAITAASLRAQIEAQTSIIAAQTQTLGMVHAQFEAGGASAADVATQEASLAASQTAIPPLRLALDQANHALAAAMGRTPQNAGLPEISLDTLLLPKHLPLSLPSDLVAQRPDVRAADATLHAATAAVGIAVANRLPQITLNGGLGTAPEKITNLFTPGNGAWTLGGQLLAPVFEGGTLLHNERAARDTARAAALSYRDVAINAFGDVANALAALDEDARGLEAQQDASAAAEKSFHLATIQYRAGGVPYLNVLTALTQAQTARIGVIKARAARLTDTVALYTALGGGWWKHPVRVAASSKILPVNEKHS